MKRYALLASIAAIGGTVAFQGSVNLQPTTPGTPQTGHLNITGTAKAGTVVGYSTTPTGIAFGGDFRSVSTSGRGVLGNASATTGATYGGLFQSFSNAGRGIAGIAVNTGGVTYGGFFSSLSVDGRGVYGQATAGTGTTYGVYGKATSPSGFGVFSEGNLGVTGVIGGNGAGITNMNASALATGSIGDPLLSANVAMRNAPNDFVGRNTFTHNAFGSEVLKVTGSGVSMHGVLSTVTGDNALGLNAIASGTGSTGVRGAGDTGGLFFGITAVYAQGNTGVSGQSNSIDGTGVRGVAASSGATFGGDFLALSASGFGVKGENQGAGGTGVFGTAGGTNSRGVIGIASGTTSAGVSGTNSSADGVGVHAANAAGLAFLTDGKSQFEGNISIGAGNNPLFPIDFGESLGNKISLWGTSATSHYGMGIQGGQFQLFTATGADDFCFGWGGSGAFSEAFRLKPSSGVFNFWPTGVDLTSHFVSPYDLLLEHDVDNDSSNSWLNVFTNNFTIEQMRINDGDEATTLFDGAVTANGIDFAEGFKVFDPTLEPGDLVVNSGSNWQYVTRSSSPYQTGVIGVVSTKPAFIAGMSFNAEDQMDPELTRQRDDARLRGDMKLAKELTVRMAEMVKEAYRPIAMMGRVPVRVTGAVRPGDHLTASAIPGCAMAMTQPGHSIGIALETNSGGQRKIMVMIQPGFFAANVAGIGLSPVALKEVRSEISELRAENKELRERLERLERLVLGNKR